MKFDTIEDVRRFLDAMPNFQKKGKAAIKNGFQNISAFLEKIGSPHTNLPIIHVAGTNGKGTTCYLLEHIYTEFGYKTGLFISPHLLSYNERVRVAAGDISDDELLLFFQKYGDELQNTGFSYFEISMLLAFWYFDAQNVDIVILETGLGGRLDSTNVVKPILTIITSIGLDHQNVLGETEAEITREKAGIIKYNVPVIVGNAGMESEQILLARASEEKSAIFLMRNLNPQLEKGLYSDITLNETIKTPFIERINKWNVAMAISAVRLLHRFFRIDEERLGEIIGKFEGVAARFEKLLPDRDWYFTGAHNYQALKSIVGSVEENFTKKPVLIFSLMKDKVSMETIKLLFNFDRRYFFQQKDERAATFDTIHSYIAIKPIEEKNYQTILKELETELVIIAGSFYFYHIVKRWIEKYSNNTDSFLT